MIERYSLPKMSFVWQDASKFQKMLSIELLAVEALVKYKKAPAQALKRIRKKARFDIQKIREIEERTQHDVVAFVNNVAQHIGQDAQYLHVGLTSSDLLDTTLALQMREAADILIADMEVLLGVLKEKARKYKDMVCIGRTHGVHAEPLTFGLKLALWYDELRRDLERLKTARKAISFGKISGAVG
ncbi:MAG: lyase family protein, partial [Candidatus Omnitrophica bacterium]|nr:lyase family protein [Candidatus Omnitrophota bacterium]